MFRQFLEQITSAITPSEEGKADPEERAQAIRLATAVLMVEVARADHDYDESEFDLLLQLIQSHFHLSPDEASELANHANETAEEVVSLHDFTQLLHNNLTENEKTRIVALLWKVAYADGSLHAFEDSLVLKISDLLFVSRPRVMRLKHDAEQAASR